MKLVCVWIALMLLPTPASGFPGARSALVALHQGADTPARESRSPAEVLGTKEERLAKASAKYAKDRFVEAALDFEGLWRDFPAEPNFLFNAAASRHGAGHHAHAAAYSREYLTRHLAEADRKEAEAQLREALVHIVPVRASVTVAPGGAGQVTLVAKHVPRESGDLRPDLLFPVPLTGEQGALVVELDPGVWIIRAQGDGYVEAEQRVEVTAGAQPEVRLQLARATAAVPTTGGVVGPENPAAQEVPPETIKRLKLGFGIGGGVATVAGVVVLGVGAGRVGGVSTCEASNYNTCIYDFRDSMRMRDLGVMTFGLGSGLLAGGLTWLGKDPRKRRMAWIVQAAIGGVGFVAGAIAFPLSAAKFNRANHTGRITDWGEHHDANRHQVPHALASTLIGLGIGMAASAATGLAIQHKYLGNLRVDAAAGATQAGLVLSGRF